MSNSDFLQQLTRAWTMGTPPAGFPTAGFPTAGFPASGLKNPFFETPLAVAAHLQQFLNHQIQEQVQLAADLARDPNPANCLSRQIAFVQQSALAWNAEVVELTELVQSKMLSLPNMTNPLQGKGPQQR